MFNELIKNELLLRGIKRLKFKEPMEVQEKVIPIFNKRNNVAVKSQTGSGKTAAYLMPILDNISYDISYPQAIIISPTRELAKQIGDDIRMLSKFLETKYSVFYGNTLITEQRKELKSYPHIVVSTPSRLLKLLQRKFIRVDDLKFVVIDEADELLKLGFVEDIKQILEFFDNSVHYSFFSATYPEQIEKLVNDYIENYEIVSIEDTEDKHLNITQTYFEVEEHKKLDFLKNLLEHYRPKKCIIFANTQNKVKSIYKVMRKWKHNINMLHGGMEQSERNKVIYEFKDHQLDILIATDLAARGINIINLDMVINFNLPFENDFYVHRIGRTGRIFTDGIAVSLCSYKETQRLKDLFSYIGYEIPMSGKKMFNNIHQKQYEDIKKTRFKKDKSVKFSKFIVYAGRNSKLKAHHFEAKIKKVKNINSNDIGNIDLYPDYTIIEVNKDKIDDVINYLKNQKLARKVYRVKKFK